MMQHLSAGAFVLVSTLLACSVSLEGTAPEGDFHGTGGVGGGDASSGGGQIGTAGGQSAGGENGGSGGGAETGSDTDANAHPGDGGSPEDAGSPDDAQTPPDATAHPDADPGEDGSMVLDVEAPRNCTLFPGATTFQPPTAATGHCYWLHDDKATFAQAEASCVSEGGHLVTIHSAGEDAFVVELVGTWKDKEAIWVGITDGKGLYDRTKGTFEWVDGTAMTYTNWGKGQPGFACSGCGGGLECCQHRAAMLEDGTFWDRLETQAYRFVCEAVP
jgi:hypothetical protein